MRSPRAISDRSNAVDALRGTDQSAIGSSGTVVQALAGVVSSPVSVDVTSPAPTTVRITSAST